MTTLRSLLDEHGKDWPDANFNARAVRFVEQLPLRFRITKPGCEENLTAQPIARIGGHRGEWAMLLYPHMTFRAEDLLLVDEGPQPCTCPPESRTDGEEGVTFCKLCHTRHEA